MTNSLRELLTRHEGRRLKPYTDTVGKLSIGIGRNLTDNGITNEECDFLFENDVEVATEYLKAIFPEYDEWSTNRQDALVDLMFNIGPTRFSGFRKMITAIRSEDWFRAALEMRHSLWAEQVPTRAEELANLVEQG